jgi:lipopolysaccharide export system protein LptA
MKKSLMVFVLFLSVLYLYSPASGQQENQSIPTDIASDKMTYAGRDNLVVFTGDVHVLRPDFELWSDELRVFLKPGQEDEAPGQQENIDKIVASGSVRIKTEGREGFSDLLTYFPDEGLARLEKNPRLVEDRNSVEGETIILNMKENTSEVLGGPQKRVRVIFHSEPENQE